MVRKGKQLRSQDCASSEQQKVCSKIWIVPGPRGQGAGETGYMLPSP